MSKILSIHMPLWLRVYMSEKRSFSYFKGLLALRQPTQGVAQKNNGSWFAIFAEEKSLWLLLDGDQLNFNQIKSISNCVHLEKWRKFTVNYSNNQTFNFVYKRSVFKWWAGDPRFSDERDEFFNDFLVWLPEFFADKSWQDRCLQEWTRA